MNINLDALKALYQQALFDKKEVFKYGDYEVKTEYARFLIEYIESAIINAKNNLELS